MEYPQVPRLSVGSPDEAVQLPLLLRLPHCLPRPRPLPWQPAGQQGTPVQELTLNEPRKVHRSGSDLKIEEMVDDDEFLKNQDHSIVVCIIVVADIIIAITFIISSSQSLLSSWLLLLASSRLLHVQTQVSLACLLGIRDHHHDYHPHNYDHHHKFRRHDHQHNHHHQVTAMIAG